MPRSKTISIEGFSIHVSKIDRQDYVSLTDIANQTERRAGDVIRDWMRNANTLIFLEKWEQLHNPDFKGGQMHTFRFEAVDNRKVITPQTYIERTGARGLISKSGRGGGTYAHRDIALQFCSWLNPEFQIFMIKVFQKLIEEDFNRRSLEWHVSKITDNVEEIRNLLDTIPGQQSDRNRLLEEE